MKYRRAELHNHSTESDGSLTIGGLVDYGEENQFGILAVTDHNTCSGHGKAKSRIREKGYGLGLLEGVEVTTFYGHVLALGLKEMVDYTELDPGSPELVFGKIREQGAVVGIAHPFCVGAPVLEGCRFSMDVKNWNLVDYIEIFNTSAGDEFSGNEKALELWENLVLQGYPLAACSGKDLHRKPEYKNHGPGQPEHEFTTFIMGMDSGPDVAGEVLGAIRKQRTIVSKGPLFEAFLQDENQLCIRFDHTNPYQDWNKRYEQHELLVTVRDSLGFWQCIELMGRDEILARLETGVQAAVVRIYDRSCEFQNLLAAGMPVYKKSGRTG